MPSGDHTTSTTPSVAMLYFDENLIPAYSQMEYKIFLPTLKNGDILKATLSWYDPPNSIFASNLLLHDLDLILIEPLHNNNARVFFGNCRNDDSNNPLNPAQRDEINNNEQIVITNPVGGWWTLRVQSKMLLASDHQYYSVVVTSFLQSES